MKKLHLLFTMPFLFILSNRLLSQNEQPVLLPERNTQYIYKINYSEYIPHETHEAYIELIKRKKLKLEYKTLQADNKDYILVYVLEIEVLRPEYNPVLYTSYIFPHFKDAFNQNRGEDSTTRKSIGCIQLT